MIEIILYILAIIGLLFNTYGSFKLWKLPSIKLKDLKDSNIHSDFRCESRGTLGGIDDEINHRRLNDIFNSFITKYNDNQKEFYKQINVQNNKSNKYWVFIFIGNLLQIISIILFIMLT